jgi:hypothetical protein
MDTIVQTVVVETTAEKGLKPNSQQALGNHTPVTLVYLQHIDCAQCRHALEELRQIAPTDPNSPSMIFFHPGSVGDGDSVRKVWPEVPFVADQDGHIYRQLLWSEEAFGQCLALTNRLNTAKDYADVLANFWQLPEAI